MPISHSIYRFDFWFKGMPSSHMRFHVKTQPLTNLRSWTLLVNFLTYNTFNGLENSKFQVHCVVKFIKWLCLCIWYTLWIKSLNSIFIICETDWLWPTLYSNYSNLGLSSIAWWSGRSPAKGFEVKPNCINDQI